GTYTAVQLQVVADHGDAVHHLRTIANQRGAFHRRGDLAVLDEIGLTGGKHELAAGDIHLTAAQIGAVDPLLHRPDDLLRIALPGQHVGIGHARHGQMGIGLAAAVTGRRHAHQARVQLVLDVTLENAVLDQRGAVGLVTLVIDGQRTAAARQGTVVDDGAQAGCYFLAHPAAVGRAALAVEVTFQAMAHRLMQQHTGPTRTHHHRHAARRRRNGVEVYRGLAYRLAGVGHGPFLSLEEAVVGTPAAAETAPFPASVVLDDDADIEPHQRPDITRPGTVAGGHQHGIMHPAQADRHLGDARVKTAGVGIDRKSVV